MFHFRRYKSLFRFNGIIQAVTIQSLPNPFRKCYSHTNAQSTLIEYLQTSLGLSPELALTLSHKFKHTLPKNPDSVFEFFKSFGLSETQIKSIIKRAPLILWYVSPESVLTPRIQFVKEKGISESDLVELMISNPRLFTRSLEGYIKPSFDVLRSILGTDELALKLLIRSKLTFEPDVLSTNANILKNYGVRNDCIVKLFTKWPRALTVRCDRFIEAVETVKDLGFSANSSLFMHAVVRIVGLSRLAWDAKFKVYASLGWSEEEIMTIFRKQPPCMSLSEGKIRKVVNYLTKDLGWSLDYISVYPTTLLFSLEKRIIPRHKFLQFLASKGLIKKDKTVGTRFLISEKRFLKDFVTKYESEIPDILKIYEGVDGLKAAKYPGRG